MEKDRNLVKKAWFVNIAWQEENFYVRAAKSEFDIPSAGRVVNLIVSEKD